MSESTSQNGHPGVMVMAAVEDILNLAHRLIDPPNGELGFRSMEGLPEVCVDEAHNFIDKTIMHYNEKDTVESHIAAQFTVSVMHMVQYQASYYARVHLPEGRSPEENSHLCTYFLDHCAALALVIHALAFSEWKVERGHTPDGLQDVFEAQSYSRMMVNEFFKNPDTLDAAWQDANEAYDHQSDEERDEWTTMYDFFRKMVADGTNGKLDPETILSLPLAFPPQQSSLS